MTNRVRRHNSGRFSVEKSPHGTLARDGKSKFSQVYHIQYIIYPYSTIMIYFPRLIDRLGEWMDVNLFVQVIRSQVFPLQVHPLACPATRTF